MGRGIIGVTARGTVDTDPHREDHVRTWRRWPDRLGDWPEMDEDHWLPALSLSFQS